MWSLKRNNTNELIQQKETHRVRKQTHGCQGEGTVRTVAGHVHTVILKMDNQQKPIV